MADTPEKSPSDPKPQADAKEPGEGGPKPSPDAKSKADATRSKAADKSKTDAAGSKAADEPKADAASSKAADKSKAAAKPAAAKPKPKPKKKVQTAWQPTDMGRRDWFLAFGWVSFTFACVLSALFYIARFFFPNVTYEPPLQFKAGLPTEYAPGRVEERFKESHGVWLVRDDEGLYALSTTCTHLGCTPNWLEGEQKFKCPCHGSGFRKSGINFEGPAPRPLERYRVVTADDGQVLVDKSKKFQWEKNEWDNAEAKLFV